MAKDKMEPAQPDKPKTSKVTIVVILFAAVLIGFGLFSDDSTEDVRDEPSRGFDPEQAATEERAQRESITELGEKLKDRLDSDTDGLDPMAAMSAVTRRQEMLQTQLEQIQKKLEDDTLANEQLDKLKTKFSDLETQISSLAEAVQESNTIKRESDRNRSREINAGIGGPSSDLTFDLEGLPQSDMATADIEQEGDRSEVELGQARRTEPRSPYGPNYIVLRQGFPTSVGGGAEAGGISLPNNPFDSDDSGASGDIDAPAQPRNSVANEPRLTPEYQEQVTADAQPAPVQPQDPAPAADESNVDLLDIPAFSFVQAETLHGVDCPIGAMSAGTDGGAGSPLQATPIVLPVKGIIRGPSGKQVNIGTAHLQGWCFGKRVDRGENGRAIIKIEAISYWDRNGKSQFISDISGNVISERDNHMGIQAPIDQVRRSYIGDQALAASVAAAAAGLDEAQFDQTRSVDTGNIQQILSGDKGITYGAKGVSAAFSKIADLINEEAENAYDAVRVNPGEQVRIIFMKPFELTNHKTEPEDYLKDAHDLLI